MAGKGDSSPPSKSDSDSDSDAPKECRKDKKKKKDPNTPKQSSLFLYFNAARNNNVKTTNPEAKFVQTKKLVMSVLCCLLIMGGWNRYLLLTVVIGREGGLQTLAEKEEKKKKNGNMKSSIIMAKVSEVQWAKKKDERQYSIKYFGDEMAKTNTIPDDLILLDNKLLWCENAKAGSSSMYFSVLRFIFGNGLGCQWHKSFDATVTTIAHLVHGDCSRVTILQGRP